MGFYILNSIVASAYGIAYLEARGINGMKFTPFPMETTVLFLVGRGQVGVHLTHT